MSADFARLDISDWRHVRTEIGGQGENRWYQRPGSPRGPEGEWLFKPARIHNDGSRQGGDWSEKVAKEVADLLGVPAAQVELARRGSIEGCLSRQVRDVTWDLITGRIWMDADQAVDYVSANANRSRRKKASIGYNLPNIHKSLRDVGPPPGFPRVTLMSGWDVFTGVLLLDAIIANQDRHEENWGVLRSSFGPEQARLAPVFDQEGGLGYQLTDTRRQLLLESTNGAFTKFVERGVAARLTDRTSGKPLTLLGASSWALQRVSPGVKEHWLGTVDAVSRPVIEQLFASAGVMSEVERRFASEVIAANVERIQREHRRPGF